MKFRAIPFLQAILLKKQLTDKQEIETAPLTTEVADAALLAVFLKLDALSMLIVGGGNLSEDYLRAIVENVPGVTIKLVAPQFNPGIKELALCLEQIQLSEKTFDANDLADVALVVIALQDEETAQYIYALAKREGKLVAIAGQPEASDFYTGALVQRGVYNFAVTNTQTPLAEKEGKDFLQNVLPQNISQAIHSTKLNGKKRHTKSLWRKPSEISAELYWRRIATYCLFAFFFMFLGHFILSYLPYREMWKGVQELGGSIDEKFYWMIAAGFLAQLVDGALGMGYGVTCTTVLLSMGVNLPAISSSIHTAEMFSSGMSGYTHYKFGNVNKKLFKTLLIPGIIGAVGGAILLSKFGESNANFIKPLLASYTLILGARILLTAVRKKRKHKKVKRVGWLAGAGGFLDSFGGGGWGPLVTSTLISKGRTPKYVIGSVSITEFFVTLASTITFFTFLGVSHWQIIAGLIIGGMLAAPLAARLVGKLPVKTMLIAVGAMVMLWSIYILVRAVL